MARRPPERLIEMGRVAGAYGVRGWVKVACEPERLAAQRTWRVGGVEYAVEKTKAHSGNLLAKLAGDSDLAIGQEAAVELPAHRWHVFPQE